MRMAEELEIIVRIYNNERGELYVRKVFPWILFIATIVVGILINHRLLSKLVTDIILALILLVAAVFWCFSRKNSD